LLYGEINDLIDNQGGMQFDPSKPAAWAYKAEFMYFRVISFTPATLNSSGTTCIKRQARGEGATGV
jgi:hypothetical protein